LSWCCKAAVFQTAATALASTRTGCEREEARATVQEGERGGGRGGRVRDRARAGGARERGGKSDSAERREGWVGGVTLIVIGEGG
jgi:hypothetical protein